MKKSEISARQRKAIRLLVSGYSVAKTAEAVGVHTNTIYAWNKDFSFQNAMKTAESEAMKSVTMALLSLAEKATTTLDDVMTGQDVHASSRIRAADIVLGRLIQTREILTL